MIFFPIDKINKFLGMEKLQEECKQYNEKDYVFKRCGEYIVILKKPQENFQCNEMRKDVRDKKYAKFRCNGLYVVDIIHGLTLKHANLIWHISDFGDILYEVGGFVKPDSYTKNIDYVCTHGIHYFLSLKAAYYYHYYDVQYLEYHENGQLYLQIERKDGLNHGIYESWNSNGDLETKGYFNHGLKDGLWIRKGLK